MVKLLKKYERAGFSDRYQDRTIKENHLTNKTFVQYS